MQAVQETLAISDEFLAEKEAEAQKVSICSFFFLHNNISFSLILW